MPSRPRSRRAWPAEPAQSSPPSLLGRVVRFGLGVVVFGLSDVLDVDLGLDDEVEDFDVDLEDELVDVGRGCWVVVTGGGGV